MLYIVDVYWKAIWRLMFISVTAILASIVYPNIARSFVYFTANYYQEYRVEVESFTVSDIHVWEKIYFVSTRNVKVKSLPWTVIDEIDIIDADTRKTVYTAKRPTATELWNKTIMKEIDYVHTEPGSYEFRATITNELPYGVQMIKQLSATYSVFE